MKILEGFSTITNGDKVGLKVIIAICKKINEIIENQNAIVKEIQKLSHDK